MYLKISQNSQENTRVRVSFFLRPATLFKKRLRHRCFPRNFVKFLRTPPTEHLRWLLLFLTVPKKYCIWMNSNFTGNQAWNKSKYFHLFLILMLKKSDFFNVKLILFMNNFYKHISGASPRKFLCGGGGWGGRCKILDLFCGLFWVPNLI